LVSVAVFVPVKRLVSVAVFVLVVTLVNVAVSVPSPVNELVLVPVAVGVPVLIVVFVPVPVFVPVEPPVPLRAPPVVLPITTVDPPVDESVPEASSLELPQPMTPPSPPQDTTRHAQTRRYARFILTSKTTQTRTSQ